MLRSNSSVCLGDDIRFRLIRAYSAAVFEHKSVLIKLPLVLVGTVLLGCIRVISLLAVLWNAKWKRGKNVLPFAVAQVKCYVETWNTESRENSRAFSLFYFIIIISIITSFFNHRVFSYPRLYYRHTAVTIVQCTLIVSLLIFLLFLRACVSVRHYFCCEILPCFVIIAFTFVLTSVWIFFFFFSS